MMRRLWLLFAQAVTVLLAVVLVLAAWKPQWWASERARELAGTPALVAPAPRAPAPEPAATPALPGHASASNSFAAAVRRAAPAVVSITASKSTLRKPSANWQRDFFGGGRNQAQTGLGSGVLVSTDG
jgi:serine protease DegQ